MSLENLLFEQRRNQARAPQRFHQVQAGVHRDTAGNVINTDPVERAMQEQEAWDARFHANETPEQKAMRLRGARASRGMDASNQWAIALGDTQLAQDMQKGREVGAGMRNAREIREKGVAGTSRIVNPELEGNFFAKYGLTSTKNPDGTTTVNGPYGTASSNPKKAATQTPTFEPTGTLAGDVQQVVKPVIKTFDDVMDKGEAYAGPTLTPGIKAGLGALPIIGPIFNSLEGVRQLGNAAPTINRAWDSFGDFFNDPVTQAVSHLSGPLNSGIAQKLGQVFGPLDPSLQLEQKALDGVMTQAEAEAALDLPMDSPENVAKFRQAKLRLQQLGVIPSI